MGEKLDMVPRNRNTIRGGTFFIGILFGCINFKDFMVVICWILVPDDYFWMDYDGIDDEVDEQEGKDWV